ncbi:MAG: hypothetical protein RL681_590, partial [Candidatus Parcubacteria bacterium]
YRLQNQGLAASPPSHLSIYQDGTTICSIVIPALNSGDFFERGPTIPEPACDVGASEVLDAQPPQYTILFRVDDLNGVVEADEMNNSMSRIMPVNP